MRVLLVTDWTAEEGGVETYLAQLRPGLEQAGDEVRLLVSSLGTGARAADYVARGYRGAAAQSVGQLFNPAAARRLQEAVRAFRPDVLHVSSFELQLSPLALRAARGVPIVHSIGWYKPLCPTGHKLRPDGSLCLVRRGRVCRDAGCLGPLRWARETGRYALIDGALGRAAAIVTCSAYMRERLGLEGVHAVGLPWPVALPGSSFRRTPAEAPLFAVAGRLSPEKGVETLIRALARLRAGGIDARVRLVGDGPARRAIVDLARGLGVADAVEITGWVRHAEVERHLAAAWAVVAPSLWAEPLGLSAVEAIVRGIPVVATAVGGYAETVEPGLTGLLCPNGDAAALASLLAEVASRRAFPDGVDARRAAALAARHDLGRHVAALQEIFARVAA